MIDVFQVTAEYAEWVVQSLHKAVTAPVRPQSLIYWLYLFTALLLAVISYNRYYRGQHPFRLKEFGRFVCPKHIYLHPSAMMDYKLFIANRFVKVGGLLTGFVSTAVIATFMGDLLASTVGSEWRGVSLNGWTIFLFTLCSFLVTDFANFAHHAVAHLVPFFWPLHSVHHSAEVLNVLTAYRKHPLYSVVITIVHVPIKGVFQGITVFLFLGKVDPFTIIGINLFYFMFDIMGRPLRHTHIWLSYGPILNYVFSSPAHHQIHHSARPEHRDCNFGLILSIWDWMFGTLVLPTEEIRKNLVFGIDLGEPQRHPTLTRAYLEPLQSIYEVLKRGILKSKSARA